MLVLALASLALVLVEAGAFGVEVVRRRRRDTGRLERVAETARTALEGGNVAAARGALQQVAWSGAMAATLDLIAERVRASGGGDRVAKALADFDFASLRRLERTRVLVRAGPALGLMGTLIPLAPALAGLAEGDVAQLSRNLRVAFSVTVLGLLVGAVAFAISLVRDRLYGQDLSDLEFVARHAGGAVVSSTRVTPRARLHRDRGGDPLDGLVNLFDLGVVLAVAFLLAALSSLKLTDLLTQEDVTVVRSGARDQTVIVKRGDRVQTLRVDPSKRVVGRGSRVGSVYRLADGRLVYVQGP